MAENLNNSQKTGLVSTFSGADVSVIFGDEYIGSCMSFTVGTNREKGPLFVMGQKEAIAFPAGKRGTGGSFILAQLGYDALMQYCSSVFKDDKYRKVTVRRNELIPQIAEGIPFNTNAGAGNSIVNGASTAGSILNQVQSAEQGGNDLWVTTDPFYVDQLPPMNVTIIGRNEQGDMMGFRVYGMVVLNEGIAISIDELNIEKRYTFMAKGVSKMMKLEQK